MSRQYLRVGNKIVQPDGFYDQCPSVWRWFYDSLRDRVRIAGCVTPDQIIEVVDPLEVMARDA